MDPIASERALGYSEPAIYPSRDFVSVQAGDRPTEAGRWWGPNSRFSITIRSPGQNEFFDADKMRLEFSVLSAVAPPTEEMFDNTFVAWNAPDSTNYADSLTVSPPPLAHNPSSFNNPKYPDGCRNAATCGLPMSTKSDAAAVCPGTPYFGLPFFSSVRASVPGLPLESFLTSDGDAQWMCATRLMCASGAPDYDRDIGIHSFGIRGAAEAAGARSVWDRMECVSLARVQTDRCREVSLSRPALSIVRTDRVEDKRLTENPYQPGSLLYGQFPGTNWGFNEFGTLDPAFDRSAYLAHQHQREGEVYCRGTPIHYSVPLSMFSHLFNAPSNLIPLGFYSTSSDTISFTFETAPASSAVVNIGAERPDVCGGATYWIIDPEIRYTKLQVSNPQLLASIESLYRGLAAVPIAPGVNIPLAFVMKFLNHGSASARIARSTGFFNVSVPANQPSMRGIAIRFCAEGVAGAGLYSGTVPPLDRRTVADTADVLDYNVADFDPRAWGYNKSAPNTANGVGVEHFVGVPTGLESIRPGASWERFSAGDGQWSGRYLCSVRPFLKNLVLRIASFRVPLDPLLDLAFPSDQPPRGLATDPFTQMSTPWAQMSDVTQVTNANGQYDTHVDVVHRAALRLMQQSKFLFSPFAKDENPYDFPLSTLFMSPRRSDGAGATFLQGFHIEHLLPNQGFEGSLPNFDATNIGIGSYADVSLVHVNMSKLVSGGGLQRYQAIEDQRFPKTTDVQNGGPIPPCAGGVGRPKIPLPYFSGPNILIIPLESIGAVYNHKDDAFALRGLDLRSISSMDLSGEITGIIDPAGPGVPTPQKLSSDWTISGTTSTSPDVVNRKPSAIRDAVTPSSWTIRVWSVYDHEHVLLPGRTDTEAQFSLIPTGATAIPSGGAPAF